MQIRFCFTEDENYITIEDDILNIDKYLHIIKGLFHNLRRHNDGLEISNIYNIKFYDFYKYIECKNYIKNKSIKNFLYMNIF